MSGVPAFGDLKPPVKAALIVATGGGVLAAFAALFANQWPIILIGLAMIAALVLAYKGVLKLLDKRKQAPMLKALSGHSAGAPKGINDPARRARLDDMRKNFETGVEKFKDAGKNIYSLPWYLLVGEPGSGKTEAIRHCKVGFPPGLQDQLQGVGGTINMNWWFTNHAVILDTAGRLMFEEVEPGSTSEWQEFLKLLKRNRANCPINGMLLVIPSESLIKDNAEAIERKGGKIAQQLDQIQRALGVRFPVFVIVTKCDLINGFREFFDDLTEPQVQDQILGWSNPNSLDTPFNPELVDQHLATVQQRLVRRRLGLMLDPVNTEDASKRRTDQVDALYAFPESLLKIAPRLRRYLEMIFVSGEWSAKPLFLRGIYFNSSMREGSALDADLAEALGMPVESLPEGRVWERDRAYFLRDLFLNKVFRERGLVTRAINTGQHLRKRKMAVFGTVTVGVLAISLLTLVGWAQLRKRVVSPRDFWVGVERAYSADLAGQRENPLVKFQVNEFLYCGNYPLSNLPTRTDIPEDQRTVARFPAALVEQAKGRIGLPAIFAPVAFLFGDDTSDLEATSRRQAVGTIMEASVLRPLVEAAQDKMTEELGNTGATWTPEASDALVQLVRLEVDRLSGNKDPQPVSVTPLVRYVLGAEKFDQDPELQGDALAQLDEAVRWEYSSAKGEGDRDFPAQAIGGDFSKQIPEAVRRFRESWKPDGSGTDLALVNSISAGLKSLTDHEVELQRLKAGAGMSDSEALAQWTTRLQAVRADGKKLNEQLAQLRQKRPKDGSLAKSHEEALKAYLENGRALHQRLIGELAGRVVAGKDNAPAAIRPDARDDQARYDVLVKAHTDLVAGAAALEQSAGGGPERRAEIEKFDTLHLHAATKDDAFVARLGMYEEADKHVPKSASAEAIKLGELKPRMDALSDAAKKSSGEIGQMDARARGEKELPKDLQERMTGAVAISGFALGKGVAAQQGAMINAWIKGFPATAPDFGKAVESYAQTSKSPEPVHPRVPMTVGGATDKFDARYNPDAAAALLGDCSAVLVVAPASAGEAAAGVTTEPIGAASRDKVKSVYDGYARDFLGYWSREMRQHIRVHVPETGWAAFATELARNPQTDTFNRELGELGTTIIKAMTTVKPVIKPDPARPTDPTPDSIIAQAESAKTTLRNDTAISNFRLVHENWRAMSSTPSAARNAILKESISFVNKYLPALPAGYDAAAPLGDFATAFWDDFALTALNRLSAQCREDGDKAMRWLRDNRRFPVGPLGPDGQHLQPADVVDMAEYLSRVGAQGAGVAPTAPPAAPPVPGSRADANTYLAALRNPTPLDEADVKWLQWAAAMLAGLPTRKDENFTCTISYLRGPDGEVERSTQYIWPDMGLAQGATVLQWQGVRQEDVKELGRIRYPGDELRLRFFKNAAANQDLHEFKVPAPWSALRLLYDGFAAAPPEKMGGDAKTWKVNVLVADLAGVKRSLWLKLEFQQELPDPRTWPR